MQLRPLTFAVIAFLACGAPDSAPPAQSEAPETATCDEQAARDVVSRFGTRLRNVPLLADDSIRLREMESAYGDLATPRLLDEWRETPDRMPGREVSSPWPDRIEIRSVRAENAACIVAGDVVYVSNAPPDSAVARTPVTMRLTHEDGWRIDSFDAATDESDSADAATRVIRQYYDAISAHRYAEAYALWSGGGSASGQTLGAFTAGFEQTADTSVEIGEPGDIEGAAGSRYVVVPIVVNARTRAGEVQRFEGTYTLRRSVVDGATAEQRSWRIYDADLRKVS